MPHRQSHHRKKVKAVPVVVCKDDAQDVRISGSFCGWSADGLSLTRDPHGVWRGELRLLPGRYEYRILADGLWCDDPGAGERVPNPFGSQNCVLAVA